MTTQKSTEEKAQRPKRWSASRKMEVIIRYLRGETLDSLSREIGVSSAEIEKATHYKMLSIWPKNALGSSAWKMNFSKKKAKNKAFFGAGSGRDEPNHFPSGS